MNSQEIDKELIRIKGHFLEKYGEDIDPWEARMHYEARENFKLLENQLKTSNDEISKARSIINGSIKQVHFRDNKQAFWFGFGKNLLFGLSGIIIIVFSISLIFFNNRYTSRVAFLAKYKNANSFEPILKNGILLNEQGVQYLILKINKSESIHKEDLGKKGWYDKKKLEVKVPLGRIQ
jgi:hypothetical protein